MNTAAIMSFVSRQVWAMRPGSLDALVARVLSMASQAEPTTEAIEASKLRLRPAQGKVAVLPVRGPLIHRADDVAEWWLGALSTERLSGWFNAAINDKAVGAIVLDVESPGGTVAGLSEAAATIAAGRGKKPVIAVANAEAASAAFYLASAATEFAATPSAMVGSVGTVWQHVDYSKALENEGIKVSIIRAGANKWAVNPFEPLSDAGRAEMQAVVDGYYSEFVRDVSKNRGVSKSVVEERFGQGLMFKAEEALSRGMIDRVATMEEIIGKLTGAASDSAKASAAARERNLKIEEIRI